MYPLKFNPLFMELIWGGNKLANQLNKNVDPSLKIGESWELSDVRGKETIVSNGDEKGETLQNLIAKYGSKLLGTEVKAAPDNRFPLLIKFIDAADNLSIQVHPDDEMAQKRHQCFGKNEMWYILNHEDDAHLIAGFNKVLTKEQFVQQAQDGTIEDSLQKIKIKNGDVFYMPAGRVHAICKGILVAEIQQTSDITYRIYDYKRTDSEGNERQLHLQESVDVVNLNDVDCEPIRVQAELNKSKTVVESPFFNTNVIDLAGKMDFKHEDEKSFHLYIILGGSIKIEFSGKEEIVTEYETVLIPASLKEYTLIGNSKILEVNM